VTPYRAAPEAPSADRDLVALGWRPRASPRAVTALAAEGSAAVALRMRLLALPDAALAGLRGVASGTRVVLLGEAALLPWIDGVIYLGRCPEAPTLTLPTAQDPSVPPGLLERALAARLRPLAPPFALWPSLHGGTFACSLSEARPVDRALLAGSPTP
jgi:hypothetical protein